MKALSAINFLLFLAILTGCSFQTKNKVFIIPAHAHNDYVHERPLLDALDCNFKSIEADVFSAGDSLFVAHDYEEITPGRTLRSLYLEPLKKRVRENNGSVYGNGEEVILLIDIKDDGQETYKLLHNILGDYKQILSYFESGEKRAGAILVIISGNRPFEFMKSQEIRYAGYDGRLENLNSEIPSGLMPMISDNWRTHFTWDGTGEMPQEERDMLKAIATKAKSKGYIFRWWGTPARTIEQEKNVWQALLDAEVGLIGTDNIKELQAFFREENVNSKEVVQLKVCAWNVEYSSNGTAKEIGEALKPFDFDVVAFSEAPGGDWTQKAGEILGMKYIVTGRYSTAGHKDKYKTIASRTPLYDYEEILMTDTLHTVTHAKTVINEKEISLYAVHFPFGWRDQAHIDETTAKISSFTDYLKDKQGTEISIVMGDFNFIPATPDSISIYHDLFKAIGLDVSWLDLGIDTRKQNTYNAFKPEDEGSGNVIDHIMYNPDKVVALEGGIIELKRPLADHKPVWALLQVK